MKWFSACNPPLSEMGSDQLQYMSQTADADTAKEYKFANRQKALKLGRNISIASILL